MGGIVMSKRRGIRRPETLKPLSRHHIEGLHLALRVRPAGTQKSQPTVEERRQEQEEFWNPNGQNQFREEEEILLPAYAQYADINDATVIDVLLEHVTIRSYMSKLLSKEGMNIEEMQTFGALLESHIRHEERVVFPMIEQALPEEKLIELAPYFH